MYKYIFTKLLYLIAVYIVLRAQKIKHNLIIDKYAETGPIAVICLIFIFWLSFSQATADEI